MIMFLNIWRLSLMTFSNIIRLCICLHLSKIKMTLFFELSLRIGSLIIFRNFFKLNIFLIGRILELFFNFICLIVCLFCKELFCIEFLFVKLAFLMLYWNLYFYKTVSINFLLIILKRLPLIILILIRLINHSRLLTKIMLILLINLISFQKHSWILKIVFLVFLILIIHFFHKTFYTLL